MQFYIFNQIYQKEAAAFIKTQRMKEAQAQAAAETAASAEAAATANTSNTTPANPNPRPRRRPRRFVNSGNFHGTGGSSGTDYNKGNKMNGPKPVGSERDHHNKAYQGHGHGESGGGDGHHHGHDPPKWKGAASATTTKHVPSASASGTSTSTPPPPRFNSNSTSGGTSSFVPYYSRNPRGPKKTIPRQWSKSRPRRSQTIYPPIDHPLPIPDLSSLSLSSKTGDGDTAESESVSVFVGANEVIQMESNGLDLEENDECYSREALEARIQRASDEWVPTLPDYSRFSIISNVTDSSTMHYVAQLRAANTVITPKSILRSTFVKESIEELTQKNVRFHLLADEDPPNPLAGYHKKIHERHLRKLQKIQNEEPLEDSGGEEDRVQSPLFSGTSKLTGVESLICSMETAIANGNELIARGGFHPKQKNVTNLKFQGPFGCQERKAEYGIDECFELALKHSNIPLPKESRFLPKMYY